MNSTSPKSSLAKIGLHIKPKPFRILILGTTGVGKTGEQLLIIYIYSIYFFWHSPVTPTRFTMKYILYAKHAQRNKL